MEKLDLHTPDFTAENIAKLAELFPNCVTETRDAETGEVKRSVDFDLLQQELSADLVEGPAERYRLDWPGKRAALATANARIDKTLRPAREESVDFDTTQNLYIEGDNLDALKLLQETYLGQVKMIYIDPPYNTGKDFIYSDNFRRSADEELLGSGQTDEEGNRLVANTESNGRFHSDWLSMMYPRLKLARNLLKEDGVIFISIDDNEVHNLRKMCDEVFGEENFVASTAWQKAYVANMTARHISTTHDSILIYSRLFDRADLGRFPRSKEQLEKFKNPDNDPRGAWKAENLSAGKFYAAGQFTIVTPTGMEVTPPKGRYWRCNEETYNKLLNEGRITFGLKGEGRPMLKKYLSDVEEGLTPETWWTHRDFGSNKQASTETKALFDSEQYFDTPKPVLLLKRIIELGCPSRNNLILDFFSGSATTAHAVMQLNAEDGGNRRHIMVQLPAVCDEKSSAAKAGYSTIAEIGKDRIRRAGAKIRAELEAQLEGELPESDKHQEISTKLARLDTGFRVLKIDSSTYAPVYKRPDEVTQDDLDIVVDNIKSDRSGEDLLFQVLLDWGVDLSLPITSETIEDKLTFTVGAPADSQDDVQAAIIACFEPKLPESIITAIAQKQPLRAVFRDSSFPDDAAKINAEQLFKHHSPQTELKTL